jgi:hypothetical protein
MPGVVDTEDLVLVDEVQLPDSHLLRRLFYEWKGQTKGRRYPARSDFDPVTLKYALGSLSLVEVHYKPLRFRWRVHGSTVAERLQFDLTRKFLDELPDQLYKELLRCHYEKVIDLQSPVVARRRHTFAQNRLWDYEALALPLSDDGSAVNMLWSSVDFIGHPR